MDVVLYEQDSDLRNHLIPQNPQSQYEIPRRQENLIPIRANQADDGGQNLYDSIDYIKAYAGFCTLKIIASLYVLMKTKTSCNRSLDLFLILMIAHDFLFATMLIFKMFVLLSTPNIDNLLEGDDETQDTRNNIMILREMKIFELKMKCLKIFYGILYTYYCLIFIFGHLQFFPPGSDCQEKAQTLNLTCFIYICLGYISVVIPLVFKAIVAVITAISKCFSFVLRLNQARVNSTFLKKMTTTYSKKLSIESIECTICIQDYKEGEKITQLKCSDKHHFHYKCIKKWLQVNSYCPICRKKVVDKKEERNNRSRRARRRSRSR